MELWIPITIAAAFLQNLRSALQKHLKGVMGTTGATFVRFGFGLPFAVIFAGVLHWGFRQPLPVPNAAFLAWAVIGGLTQIGATALLVHLFSLRNFAAGTAYSRTEPMQAALFGFVFLGDRLNGWAAIAIAVSVVGVVVITLVPGTRLRDALRSRAAGIGLLSGTLFGASAVAYRAASLSLAGPTPEMQAAVTLVATTAFQTVLMLGWMAWRNPGEFGRIARAWKPSVAVGLVGATASFGWFTAMTLQNAALVKSLAQVEMLFTVAASVLVFRETVSKRELAGCGMIAGAIVILLLGR
ncbi:MAG: hypothetical protein DI629_08430 [Mesorhizobium amorphae]|nr:MAG: hypothetical protein DI629_08430 [Mesorhizobium amorphae]